MCVVRRGTAIEGRLCSYMSCLIRELSSLFPQRVATDGLVDLMGRFPTTTYFFVNAWTWGYEEMLTSISAHFGDKVGSSFDATPFLSMKFKDTRGSL